MLPAAMARPSSGGVAIRYGLPVFSDDIYGRVMTKKRRVYSVDTACLPASR